MIAKILKKEKKQICAKLDDHSPSVTELLCLDC